MRISDWSSDVCSSDLAPPPSRLLEPQPRPVTFQLSPEPQSTSKRASAAPKAETAHKPPPRPPEPLPPAPPVAPPIPPLPFLTLSQEEFAAAEIPQLPSPRREQTSRDSPGDTWKNSVSAYGDRKSVVTGKRVNGRVK